MQRPLLKAALNEIPHVLPLILGFIDLVMGRGFVAEVTTDGRATLAQQEGEWWVSGVNPGGIAASGATVAEALATAEGLPEQRASGAKPKRARRA